MAPVDDLREALRGMMVERGVHRLADFEPQRDPSPFSSASANTQYWRDSRPYYTGYEGGVMFAWDQYFEAIQQWHAGFPSTWARNGLCLFLDSATPEGFIPRTVPKMWWSMFQAQPFMCQLALLLARWEGDARWLFPAYYFRLKAYLCYWLRELDPRGCGLSVWDHAGHTGMDNHYERAGHFHDAYCEGVDLNSYLVRELDALATLSTIGNSLGLVPDESQSLRAQSSARRQALTRWCWEPSEQILFDYHARQHRPIAVRYAGIFAALWAGVLSQDQAHALVHRHLLNPDEFARPHPIPALAASEPGYHNGWLPSETLDTCSWRAHTWLPLNYMTIHGLQRYGFVAEAESLAASTEALFVAEPFREYYQTETGEGMGRQGFLGWSSLALFVRQEVEHEVDPSEPTDEPLPDVEASVARTFTMIELMLVIAIIGILAAILLPALASSKAQAKQIMCLNRQRQFYLAGTLYATDSAWWPASHVSNTWGIDNHTFTDISPYLGGDLPEDGRVLGPADNFWLCPEAPFPRKWNLKEFRFYAWGYTSVGNYWTHHYFGFSASSFKSRMVPYNRVPADRERPPTHGDPSGIVWLGESSGLLYKRWLGNWFIPAPAGPTTFHPSNSTNVTTMDGRTVKVRLESNTSFMAAGLKFHE